VLVIPEDLARRLLLEEREMCKQNVRIREVEGLSGMKCMYALMHTQTDRQLENIMPPVPSMLTAIITCMYSNLLLVFLKMQREINICTKYKKGSPYSITERRCNGSLPGSRLPLLSARPAVTLATLKRAATNFAAW